MEKITTLIQHMPSGIASLSFLLSYPWISSTVARNSTRAYTFERKIASTETCSYFQASE